MSHSSMEQCSYTIKIIPNSASLINWFAIKFGKVGS